MKNIGKRGLAIFLIFAMLLSVPSLIISVAAASGTEVDLYVDTVTAMPENTVQVTVQLQNNPGLSSLKFDIAYDSYLSLENVTFGQEFGAYVLAPTPYKNPQTISFISPLEEVNANGTFATLTFRVSANAPDNYAADITVECDEENVFSGDLSPVNVNVHNGCVNIIHGIPGDIDGDRKVNNKDAIMLFRYVAGGEVAVDEAALDVNCDGKVNNKDAITLFRYVAGWDVEIGRGPSSIACRHDKTEMILGFMPTCTEAGLSDEERCTACGELLRASVAIPPLGHVFEDGFCTRCGEQDEIYDPNDPLYVATPEIINDYAQADPNNGLYNSDIGSSEIIRQGDRSFLRLTSRGVDPYVVFTNPLQSVEIGRYMAISYRTNSVSDGQFFMGSGYGWTGRGDNIIFDWNEDGAWNLAIIDLENVGLTSIEDNILTYARIDFFTEAGAEGDYFDIEYIAFFNSFEAAEKYDFDLHEIPMWTTQSGVITHLSFDQLYLGTGEANDSEQTNIFFFPGQSLDWDLIAEVNPQTVDYLTYWGWVGIMDSVGQFGYRINGNTPVYDDAWTHETEDEVYYTAMMTGADTASRMKIAIPVDGLSGDNTVCVLYRHPDGREVCLTKFELIVSEDIVMPDIPDEPDDPDIPGPPAIGSYDVPMDIWSVSGHASGITSSDDWALGPMIHAAGLDKAALLHQGAIGVGELDLSMYSHAIIYFGCDNSSVTEERYNESANNRIILSKVDTHMINSPEEEDIIAAETYTLYGWLPEAVIIDLTDIDYQGPVYVTYDTLPGTFMLISSIEFVVPEDEEAEIVWGDDSKFTVCPDNVSNWVGNSKKDWCVERGDVYMASVKNTIVVNGFDFISFRGWANPTYKGIEIDSFGYQINDERPVFKDTFMIKEPSLNEALNSSAARRYEGIKIPVADLEVGSYNIKLLVKDTNGVVYSMNHAWNGDITFVKKEFSDKPDTDFDIDWTTYRSASDYEEPEYGEEPSYRPAPGYEYTDEGFHMISADYTDTTPFGTIQTKTPVDLQNGFYMEIRVDDYPYGGQDGMADHWISFHIWDSQNIAPGNVLDYGQGWLNLCRTPGNGNIGPAQSFICSSAGAGSFLYQGDVAICPLLDENGKEIYTFEVVYDRGEYLIYICDVLIQGTANIANHLNSLNPNGEFYVGVTFHAGVVGGNIEATILKCGNSAENATVPVGTDSKAPEENVLIVAPIADSSTVPVNMPALLVDASANSSSYHRESAYGMDLIPQADNTFRMDATSSVGFINFPIQKKLSYEASDFPVIAVLMEDPNWLLSNITLRYCAGKNVYPDDVHWVQSSIFDDNCIWLGENEEYYLMFFDLSELLGEDDFADGWTGRINSIRFDYYFDIAYDSAMDYCFFHYAGVFRSVEEATVYSETYMKQIADAPDEPATGFTPVGDVEIDWASNAADVLSFDGDSEDWEQLEAKGNLIHETIIDHSNLNPWIGEVSEDFSMKSYFLADADYLYMAFDVTDPTFTYGNTPLYYNGDAIQVGIDMGGLIAQTLISDPDLLISEKPIFYSFACYGDGAGIQIMRQESDGNDGVLDEYTTDGQIKGSSKKTANGWFAEIAIAWDLLMYDVEWLTYLDNYTWEFDADTPLQLDMSITYIDRDEIGGAVNMAGGTFNHTDFPSWDVWELGMHLTLPWAQDRQLSSDRFN